MTWSRATKLVVVASTIVAGLAELYFAAPGWTAILPFTIVAMLAALAMAWYTRALLTRAILFVIYLAPATFLFIHGSNHFSFEATWILPLIVLLVADRRVADWSIPPPWRMVLAWWALVVSVSWPIIWLREVDFSRWLLNMQSMPNSSVGTSPELVLIWMLYVVLGHNVGILWIDALYRWYHASLPQFRREVIIPLVAASALACLVGVYQATVDLGFLSGHVWPTMLRAAGTLMDANAFGMIVALMGPAAVALAMRQGSRASVTLSALSLAIAFAGVLTSGSRSALAALLASTVLIGIAFWQESRTTQTHTARSHRNQMIAASVVVAGVLALLILNSATMSVVLRLYSLIPGLADTTFLSSITSLWQRAGYGSAAMRMIAEHPLEGVGGGTFHSLIMDYRTLVTDTYIGPDNAQNWYRHVLAEYGLVGALPMLAWTVMFAKKLFSRSPAGADRFSLWAIASPLIAFGLISFLSVPGQGLTVILTFWTLAFWFLQLREEPRPVAGPEPAWAWITITGLVVVHAGLTLASARGDLLPRHRAARFNWDYSGGISEEVEPNADGSPGRRWASLRSMSTIPVKGRVLKFVAWVDHPDADTNPVHVRVRADGKDYFDGDLKRPPDAIRLDIPAASGAKQMIVETWISRTFRPSDFGSRDRRDLGLSVRDWTWE